ncbi:3'(2'),5'-bisphosphate nucleotidase CysQ [Saccharospirillum sp. HFRX-1]|uniref:3'(2'),5'-bisphosphate nucleotidase CysQ family protein n=1 Tax=unclassified Saccharospirillum TaxID=2633430 RepID=UPI003711A671
MSLDPQFGPKRIASLYQLMQKAGDRILRVYGDSSRWQTNRKADDSPVTAADIAASETLVAGLPKVIDRPVLSEEAVVAWEERRHWQQYWLVDPMDGTREFLHRSGEFVINVAFMDANQPVFGMLYQPVTGRAWWGGVAVAPQMGWPDQPQPLRAGRSGEVVRVLGSRRTDWRGQWRPRLEAAGFQVETQSVGSALKFMHLAEGQADIYPRLGPTSEWDTAAPQAILEAAGGALVQWDGSALEYGKADTLNPEFVAVSDPDLLPTVLNR